MSNMEFLYQNIINTTTLISVASGTDTVSYLFDRKSSQQYQSSGYNDDTKGVTLTMTYPSNYVIDRIVLENINLKSFKVYYNSNTANTFTLLNAATTVSDWSSNSTTSLYLKFSPITVTVVTIAGTTTMAANEEKKIGEWWICKQRFELERNPDFMGFNPKLDRKEYIQEMSDGGTTIYAVGQNYSADIELKYMSSSQTALFLAMYNTYAPFVFVPFPTSTSWTEEIYEVNWVGDYGFIKPAANNYSTVGYEGNLRLRETPK